MTADQRAGLLVYDGDCGFCTTTARWAERRLGAQYRVEPWQQLDLAVLGLSDSDVADAAWWVSADGTLHRGHMAVAEALSAMAWPWRAVGNSIGLPPLRWIGAPAYAIVARYRHRLPGSTDACRLPK